VDGLAWARAYGAEGAAEVVSERPWARVSRIGDGLWLKECRPVQAFEARLTAVLFERWPDRVTEVIAHDEERAWLLLRDGGTAIDAFGDAERAFAAMLPLYAELQQGEAGRADEHLAHGAPDVRVERLPAFYGELCARGDLPLAPDEVAHLRGFASEFERLCADLPPLPPTVQHDDLHTGNVTARDGRLRVLDWGDSSISHPFFSLVFAHWHGHELDAYLEPWGDAAESVDLALRVGSVARLFKWIRIRDAMTPAERAEFDGWFPNVLRKTLEQL